MGKRSNFVRMKNDFYATPYKGVVPLIPHLNYPINYIEPCAGDGRLIKHLSLHNCNCVSYYDLPVDATSNVYDTKNANFFITNPPWTRTILHPLITNLRKQLPTWLLFDAGWAFTKQASEHLQYCQKIVTIGRLKWIEGSNFTGKDDCAWYLFLDQKVNNTLFFGR